jgi:hypothetical protein
MNMNTQPTTTVDAYYLGRNSIGDQNEVWYRMGDCPEVHTAELIEAFQRGVHSVKAENRLNRG